MKVVHCKFGGRDSCSTCTHTESYINVRMLGNLSHFLGVVLSSAIINVTMLKCPESSKKIMVGKNLELEWKFDVSRIAGENWRISLYLFNFTGSSKSTIVRLLESGEISRSPAIPPETFQRLNYSLSADDATFLRRNTNFADSAGYGISFESDSSEIPYESVTEVLIVDMLSNEEESSNIVKTWIGQQVELICSVFLKSGADAPTFTWIDEAKNITITENISISKTKSVLTMNPRAGDDFGSYVCRATTIHTKIKYNITLMEIEYAGYPLCVDFSPSKRSLSWVAPIHRKDGSSISFIVQYHDEATCEWVTVNKTVGTSITLSALPIFFTGDVLQACNVRVCSTNQKDLENRSCSESRKFTSNYSHPPFVNIRRDSTDNTILSWETQPEENIPILGYVIHIIKKSKDHKKRELRSMHLDYKMDKEKYIFRNWDESIMFRVCIRNSLCLYEKSCSREIGLSTVTSRYTSTPEKLRYNIQKESKTIKLTWAVPKTAVKEEMKYSIQKQIQNGNAWCVVNVSANRYFYFNYTARNEIIRVCAEKNDGYVNKPCTNGIKINLVYPSEPTSVRITYMRSSGLTLSWKHPQTEGDGPLKYIVEFKKLGNGRWMEIKSTEKLYIRLKSVKPGDRIRVCVENNAGRTNQSCSRSLDLNEETIKGWASTNEGATCFGGNVVYKLVMVLNASILLFTRQ